MLEVLVSTMYQKDDSLYQKMNISCDALIINQCDSNSIIDNENFKIINTTERGLSKSRNMAIKESNKDICVIADDDLIYNDEMKNIISEAYKKYNDASVIAFYVESTNRNRPTSRPSHSGYLGYLETMKLASFMLTIKRKDIISNNIFFNTNFGAGSGIYSAGEENIFLFECLKKGLKVVYVDKTIASVSHAESTWWSNNITKKNLYDLGAAYYLMFPKLYLIAGIQYIIRKWRRIDKDINFKLAINLFNNGVKSLKEKKIFLVGDIITDTGPGVANRILFNGLSESKTYLIKSSNQKSLLKRILELPLKIKSSNIILICSFSKINYFVIKLAKIFDKKIVYLLHGYVEYEERINLTSNKDELDKIHKLEQNIFINADKIVCVSKKCMEQMKLMQIEFKDKFDYIYNGVLLDEINYKDYQKNNGSLVITTIGGGMVRKNIISICQAIQFINENKLLDKKIILNVIGPQYTEHKRIINYNFVNYFEKLSHEEVLNILKNSNMYIQNSIFETFGLAIIEAYKCGCKILLSEVCGCIDCFEGLKDQNIILLTDNEEKIANKIIMTNNEVQNITLKDLSPLKTAKRFEKILELMD